MEKFLTDVHTHSDFSFDGEEKLEVMVETAFKKGIAFYGIAEHVDFDVLITKGADFQRQIDAEEYFHCARHLQEDYAGCMNVLVGAEFGYSEEEKAHTMYLNIQKKYRPDFVVNSVHCENGEDYYYGQPFDGKDKKTAIRRYLQLIRKSLDAPYDYDIVGHIGYAVRYAPYTDKKITLAEFGEEFDDIFKTVIERNKILEVNSSNKGGDGLFFPNRELLKRYYELGGRKISFASDAHNKERILSCREEVVKELLEIGFTEITVPCCGEHIKIPL